jgi:hypothetical protein
MFKFLIPLVAFSILIGCNTSKVVTISSDQIPLTSKGLVFENDTVRITYKFWGNRGSMTYDVYNKLNVPLFFDWKTSAYIKNDKMNSYWRDETNTNSSGVTAYGYGMSSNSSKAKSIHEERIGVTPPHSAITHKGYSLINPKSDLAISPSYTKDNSPLVFRNYLVMSTNEKFEGTIFYVDNSFFVSSVIKASKNKCTHSEAFNMFYIPPQ